MDPLEIEYSASMKGSEAGRHSGGIYENRARPYDGPQYHQDLHQLGADLSRLVDLFHCANDGSEYTDRLG